MIRVEKLDDMSLLDFNINTYESNHWCPHRGEIRADTVPYLQGSHKKGKFRVIRTADQEAIPYFPGKWISDPDNMSTQPLYCASILMLLCPWRNIQDITDEVLSFEWQWIIFFT